MILPVPIFEYDITRSLDLDAESAELRLRYRDKKVYAVGHGLAADWELNDGKCTRVFLEAVPSFVVSAVETTGFESESVEAEALRLDNLSQIDTRPDEVASMLDAFVEAFSAWVSEQEDDTVSRIDPDSGRVVRTIPVGDRPRYLTADFERVWVPNAGDGTVSVIDARTNRVLEDPVRVGRGVDRADVGLDAVWVTRPVDGTVLRIEPGS
jgi:YVTN family beta-propeller protein